MQESFLFDLNAGETGETLEQINAEMLEKAKRIPALENRVFIFGVGRVGSRVALVGESPGPPDADSGQPFMGLVGQFLDKILASIGLKRETCYLTNVVKYISAGDEITPEISAFFTPYLHRELLAVKPEIIIALGNTPTKALLKTKKQISQARGEWHDYHEIKLMPTFNPAYLLRDPTKKREVWEDMKKVRDALNSLG
jgi:DNA polymerase